MVAMSAAGVAVSGAGALPGGVLPGVLPDGVLPVAGRDLTLLVSVVGCAAAVEAAWNVGSATLNLLHLPLPLAVGFPLVLEAAAVSCAVQDLRDRRQGIRSRALAVGTYLGLAVSAVVNGLVGYAGHGAAGLLEVLPPVVLAGLIHVHGHRAVRAWQSRAVLRPVWRAEQLRRAQVDSAAEVLPLLAGDDVHGRATVALLRRRLESGTLTPAQALLAAGWHDRNRRALPDTVVRRLETVAATVWPDDGQPPAPPAPAAAPVAAPTTPATTAARATTSKTATAATAAATKAVESSSGRVGARSLEELRVLLVEAVRAGRLPAMPSADAIRHELACSPGRARTLRDERRTQQQTDLTEQVPGQLDLVEAAAGLAELDVVDPVGLDVAGPVEVVDLVEPVGSSGVREGVAA